MINNTKVNKSLYVKPIYTQLNKQIRYSKMKPHEFHITIYSLPDYNITHVRALWADSHMVRSSLSSQQPPEVDIPATCSLNSSGRVNVLRISIGHDLKHGPWFHCRISSCRRVSLVQLCVIQSLQYVAQQSNRIIFRYQTFQT